MYIFIQVLLTGSCQYFVNHYCYFIPFRVDNYYFYTEMTTITKSTFIYVDIYTVKPVYKGQ